MNQLWQTKVFLSFSAPVFDILTIYKILDLSQFEALEDEKINPLQQNLGL